MTDVIGFKLTNLSKGAFISDIGIITGVVYISSCIPNVMKYTKSLYFVVNDVIIKPIPNPRNAIIIKSINTKNKYPSKIILCSPLKTK